MYKSHQEHSITDGPWSQDTPWLQAIPWLFELQLFGQCHFRQKESDKNHISLSPCRLSEIQGFVLTSDQVHPEDSVVIGSVVMTPYPMDLVFIPMYLGCVQGCVMDHKHQDQNQAIMDERSRSE